MRISKKVQQMAVFIEFLTGAGLSIFFHWVLHYPEAAYSMFGIGILLSLATYLLREDMEQSHNDLTAQYHQAHEIVFAVAGISDPDCHAKAHEVLAGTKRTIAMLQQGYVPLDETEFYLENAKCADLTQQRIKTVSPLTTGWQTRGALVNYYQSNLRALIKGIAVTRIFVIQREALNDPDTRNILITQFHDGIDVRVAFRDECPAPNDISDRDTTSSFDFAVYDDHIAAEVFSQHGKFYGRKTGLSSNVDRFLRLYELIEHGSHAIGIEGDTIVLASESYKLAA